jgi:hypothetical protein
MGKVGCNYTPMGIVLLGHFVPVVGLRRLNFGLFAHGPLNGPLTAFTDIKRRLFFVAAAKPPQRKNFLFILLPRGRRVLEIFPPPLGKRPNFRILRDQVGRGQPSAAGPGY